MTARPGLKDLAFGDPLPGALVRSVAMAYLAQGQPPLPPSVLVPMGAVERTEQRETLPPFAHHGCGKIPLSIRIFLKCWGLVGSPSSPQQALGVTRH